MRANDERDSAGAPTDSWPARLARLMQNGNAALESDELAVAMRPWRLLLIGAIGIAIFGAAGGVAGGLGQIGLAATKHLIVAACAVVLTAPSLFVLSALGGATWQGVSFGRTLLRAWAVAGVGLAALAPIVFVFAAGSRRLGSVIFWSIASLVGALLLVRRQLREAGVGSAAAGFWLLLLLVVALQGATVARPMLVRAPGEGRWVGERLGFLEQMGRSWDVRLGLAPPPGE